MSSIVQDSLISSIAMTLNPQSTFNFNEFNPFIHLIGLKINQLINIDFERCHRLSASNFRSFALLVWFFGEFLLPIFGSLTKIFDRFWMPVPSSDFVTVFNAKSVNISEYANEQGVCKWADHPLRWPTITRDQKKDQKLNLDRSQRKTKSERP